MAFYCPNCGVQLQDGVNFCPNCGASVNGRSAASSSGLGNAVKTAAVIGGAAVAANAVSNLAWRLTHRPRPIYTPPPPPPPPPHHRGPGPRGHHGPGGPGGPRGGGRW